MGPVRVLVVEDEDVLAETIARGLRWEGMAVDLALDGDVALEKATVNAYDVIVLDRDLPGVHGDEVCRRLAGGEGRILMLTAARAVAERVEGLGLASRPCHPTRRSRPPKPHLSRRPPPGLCSPPCPPRSAATRSTSCSCSQRSPSG